MNNSILNLTEEQNYLYKDFSEAVNEWLITIRNLEDYFSKYWPINSTVVYNPEEIELYEKLRSNLKEKEENLEQKKSVFLKSIGRA